MKKFIENKHFVTTVARVIMYSVTLVVVAILFVFDPEQAVKIMNIGAYVLGGAALSSKLGN